MKKENLKPLKVEIEIPEGAQIEVTGQEIKIKKGDKEIKKNLPRVELDKKDNKIIIKTKRSTKREIKQIKTAQAHIKNMLRGLEENFVYKLQICSLHFPMTLSVKGDYVIIKNFLGETKERKARIIPGASVKIDKEVIIVESHDKESAGQTASNIEKSAKSKDKDRRIFQDGIFMIEKSGREI